MTTRTQGGPAGLAATLATLTEPATSWDEMLGNLELVRLGHLARMLHRLIATSPPAVGERCAGLLRALPPDGAERLLRAPALCETLRTGDAGGDLVAWLVREVDPVDWGDVAAGWAALGDRWVEPGAGRARDGLRVLGCGIPLDRSLAPRLTSPAAGLVEPEALDDAASARAIAAMDAALDLLAETMPDAHLLVTTVTSNIVVRVDRGRTDESWSASSGFAVGRTLVVNPERTSAPRLAENLLHEAVHTALDIGELKTPLYAGMRAEERIASPWSGAPLTAHAFVHACVVWSVLLELSSRLPSTEEACVRQGYIAAGFEQLDRDAATSWRRLSGMDDITVQTVQAACEGARPWR